MEKKSVNQTQLFNGKNTVEAKQWLDKHYGDSAPEKSTIIDWYHEFKRGRKKTDDAERSGCLGDYWLFVHLNKMLQGMNESSNEEMIAETEAYLESKDKSFYKKGIENLKKRWN